jgi:hypothetical protein
VIRKNSKKHTSTRTLKVKKILFFKKKAAREYFYSTPDLDKSKQKKTGMFSSVGSSNIPTSTIDDSQQEEDDEIYTDFDKEDLVTDFKVNQKIKIKLIIVEISHTKKEQNIRKFLSPLATTFGKNPQFGMFHSALGKLNFKNSNLKLLVLGIWVRINFN